MPTIYRFRNCRVFIYTNDHTPAHVHVTCAGKEAVFNLTCNHEDERKLRENKGFSRKEVNEIYAELITVMDELCASWREIHG
jgi:hypothetical protein